MRLEEDKQPWALVRYPVRAKYVDCDVEQCYELVFFQTYDRDDGIAANETDRRTFLELSQKYGLSMRYKSNSGEVWAKDDSLRDLVNRYHEVAYKWDEAVKIAASKHGAASYRAKCCQGTSKYAEAVALRSEAMDELRKVRAAADRVKKGFIKRNKIVIYQF